ncbi:MAG: hypothetical protein ACPGVU_07710 [Limisphaerales bacterium]
MKRLRLCFLSALLAMTGLARAEYRTIAIEVHRAANQPAQVNIHSDVTPEKKHGISITEAAVILRKARGWGSAVGVAMVTSGIDSSSCKPLVIAIAQNDWSELETSMSKEGRGRQILRQYKLTHSTPKQEPKAESSNPKKFNIADLKPSLAGMEIVMTFKVRKVIWLSGAVPKGGIRSFAIEGVGGDSAPRFSVLVMGDLARSMDRFGFSPPRSKHPMIGKFIEIRGQLRAWPAPTSKPEKGPSYSLRASDPKGFRLRS